MGNRARRAVALLGCMALWGVPAAAQEVPADAPQVVPSETTAELARLLHFARGYRTAYDQRTYDTDDTLLEYRRGRIWAQRPLRFRVVATEPYSETVVSDGTLLWYYEPDLRQAQEARLSDTMGDLPVALLVADAHGIERDWMVEEVFPPEAQPPVRRFFSLTARSPTAYLRRLRLEVYRGRPSKIQGWDASEARLELVLFDSSYPPAMNPALFRFDLPQGVDLIRARELLARTPGAPSEGDGAGDQGTGDAAGGEGPPQAGEGAP